MTEPKGFKTQYLRPWMKEYGAAAAASGTGLKGIIAGKVALAYYIVRYNIAKLFMYLPILKRTSMRMPLV